MVKGDQNETLLCWVVLARDFAAPGLSSAEEIREIHHISSPGIFPLALQPRILVSLPHKWLFLSQPTVPAWQGRGFVLPDPPSVETLGLIPALTLLRAGGCSR